MYFVVHKDNRMRVISYEIIDGFLMGSTNKTYMIASMPLKNIKICSLFLASPMVTDLVLKKYNKLVFYLTDLLVDDDDSGDSFREALNQIEKFRLEIKVKYRDYLKRKELEMMSKQLMRLQKEANDRLLEIHNSFVQTMEEKRSK